MAYFISHVVKWFGMKKFKTPATYCFSPPVMMATFIIEIFLAIHTIWKYKMSNVTRLAVAVLVALAVFQLAEYFVCEGTPFMDSVAWAKVGYIAITLLPPLGMHLIASIAGDTRRWPYLLAYACGAGMISFFLFATNGLTGSVCMGNYVIFQQHPGVTVWYALYYYGFLLLAMGYALYLARAAKPHIATSLKALTIGYASFIVPTTFVNIINPETIKGIPSIMCGFAVLLAVMIAGRVLPAYHAKTKK